MLLRKDLILVTLVVAILMLMVVPLNQTIIDILLTINISLAVVLLMVAIYLKHPSDFSTFPSVILLGTVFRLALSVGTTRLILTEADGGQIIDTFGEFVVQGNVAVGLVIFLIITVVQFLVVTKGAERVAEVGARFALDALPGKQMSIDADIRAGTLEAQEGERMRKRLDKDSQFFGTMDGAMKFVKGDAIASLIIIAINLIGGIAVGVSMHGLSFSQAGSVYSLLTIGDGLVAQVPALLMSLCAGLIVTRATNADNDDLGTDISKELLVDARVPGVAAFVVFAIGLIPGFPIMVFATVSISLLLLAAFLRRAEHREKAESAVDETPDDDEAEAKLEVEEPTPLNERFTVTLGADLAAELGMETLQARAERQFAAFGWRAGIAFGAPMIVVSNSANPRSIMIALDDVPMLRDEIPAEMSLCTISAELVVKTGHCNEDELQPLNWPTFKGVLVPNSVIEPLSLAGHTVADLGETVSEQVFRLYERHAGNLFARLEFENLMDDCVEVDSLAVDVIMKNLGRAGAFQTFRYLVEDGVPLRPRSVMLDALQYWIERPDVATPAMIAEGMRGSMKRQLCHAIAGPDGVLGIILLAPEMETLLRRRMIDAHQSVSHEEVHMSEELVESILSELHRIVHDSRKHGRHLVIVAAADIRRRLRHFLASNDLHLPVFAPHEIAQDVRSFPLTVLRLPEGGEKPQPITQEAA